jgi:hypothetical protein
MDWRSDIAMNTSGLKVGTVWGASPLFLGNEDFWLKLNGIERV